MQQDATERFMNALQANGQKIKGDGRDRWRATCPAHNGQDLNLAVAKGDQGVLLKCWSHSCAEADIASSIGLRLTDLFDQDGQAVYDYGGGHKVYRTREAKGKRIRQENAPQVTHLYQPDGSLPLATSDVVVIGEGEKTVDALVRLGARCVATWPGGSSAVGKVDLEPLRGKKIILVPDNDEPGEKAAATLMWRLQKIAEVRVWRVPTEFDGHPLNDAADLLLAGGALDNLATGTVTPTEPVDTEFESAVTEATFHERVRWEAKQRATAERNALVSDTLTPKPLGEILDLKVEHDWLVPDLLERRDRLMVTGHEGSGKSWILRQMVVCMAAGIHPFNASQPVRPARALVIDTENTEEQWSRAAGYLTRVAESRGTGNPRRDVHVSAGVRIDLARQADVNQVHKLIDQHKPDVLYIGPLYKLVSRAITTDDDAAPLILALDGFRERGVCLLMEAHAGHAKAAGGQRDLRPRGSSALLGWPEFGYGLEPQDEGEGGGAWWTPWRGQREKRRWPKLLRRGYEGELPWEVEVWS